MEKLEKYVDKETFRKLSKNGILSWKDLFNIHNNQKEEFWSEFSNQIIESDRIKLEKIIYRECRWDNDKYFFHYNDNLLPNGTFKPRKNNDDSFELIKYERITVPGNWKSMSIKTDSFEDRLSIDRITRTCEREYRFNKDIIQKHLILNYYDLNSIFGLIRREDVIEENFIMAFPESPVYSTYKLTYSNETIRIYNYWKESKESKIEELLTTYEKIFNKNVEIALSNDDEKIVEVE